MSKGDDSVEIVIDASAVMAVLLGEPSRDRLIDLAREAELLAPPTLPWEIGNALSALFRRARLGLEQAMGALASLERIPIRLADVELAVAVALAHEKRIYAYDAFVLECARRYRAPLLSLDEEQRSVARSLGIEVIEA